MDRVVTLAIPLPVPDQRVVFKNFVGVKKWFIKHFFLAFF